MAKLFPTAEAADISGYYALYVNTRRPASTAATESATTSAAAESTATTLTAGGTALKFITKPFAAAVTLTSAMIFSIWGRESVASANCTFSFNLYKYSSGSEGSTFWTQTTGAAELGVSGENVRLVMVTTTGTATAFAVGDRLVLKVYLVEAGGDMAAGTVYFTYDGPTEGASGDTYVETNEPITLSECQTGSGTTPVTPGFGQGFYNDVVDKLNALVDAKCIDAAGPITTLIDDLELQRDNL
jgi:hypothetical protein